MADGKGNSAVGISGYGSEFLVNRFDVGNRKKVIVSIGIIMFIRSVIVCFIVIMYESFQSVVNIEEDKL